MSSIPDVTSGSIDDVSTSGNMTYPIGYMVDDILFAMISQDNGGTDILNADPDWIIIGANSSANGQRGVMFYKIMTSTTEKETEFTGHNETWSWSIFTIRGADTVNPIHLSTRTTWSGSGDVDSPTISTTIDDCLIIHAWSSDQRTRLRPKDLSQMTYIAKNGNLGQSVAVGYKQQIGQGTTDIVTVQHEATNEGGHVFVVAIKPNATIGRARESISGVDVAIPFGDIENVSSATDPSLVLTSNINGLAVFSASYSFTSTNISGDYDWLKFTKFVTNSSTTGAWCGNLHTLNSTLDLADKNCSLTYQLSNFKVSRAGLEGFIIVLIDSIGNWGAFQITDYASHTDLLVEVRHFNVNSSDTYDESAVAPDYTDINRMAYLINRAKSSTGTANVFIRDLTIKDTAILVNGSIDDPISPAMLSQAIDGWGYVGLSGNQGSGQGVATYPIQIGNGTTETYADFTATSYEPKVESRLNSQISLTSSLIIYASANDTMNITNCVIATVLEQDFIIHALSSTLATYSFLGGNIVGWNIIWKTGITCDGANISNGTVLQNGGTFDGCNVKNSLITCDDLAEIKNCTITSGGTGHGIELSTVEDIIYTGNSHYGFGLDGTTDAAIYNNTGGAVEITIAGGGDTPTVRNGVGASTTIVSPNPTFELTNLKTNTEVRVYRVSDDVEIMGVEDSGTTFTDTYAHSVDIPVYIHIHNINYEFIRIELDLIASGISIPVQQNEDTAYLNP